MKKAFVLLALALAAVIGGCSTYRDSAAGASGKQGSGLDDFFHDHDEARTHVSD